MGVGKAEQPLLWRHNDRTVVKDPAQYVSELDMSLRALYRQTAAVTAYINQRDTSRTVATSPDHDNETFEFVTSLQLACSLTEIEAHLYGPKRYVPTKAERSTRVQRKVCQQC